MQLTGPAAVVTVRRCASSSVRVMGYHFKGKDALFEAVLEALETDVGRRTLAATAGAPSPAAALRAGCLAWVRIAGDPVVQRILLIDAPSVLGWVRWRELEERHALGLIKGALAVIARDGGLAPDLVEIFSHVLLATMNEIALFLARADEPGAAESSAAGAVEEVLSRLLGNP
jgi:AcrR family transcriptional regulator